MNLNQILSTPIPNKEKKERKILYSTISAHEKISLLSSLTGAKKSEVLNNIIHSFFNDHKEKIKELLAIKRRNLDDMFDNE